jgi:hypothetical protein
VMVDQMWRICSAQKCCAAALASSDLRECARHRKMPLHGPLGRNHAAVMSPRVSHRHWLWQAWASRSFSRRSGPPCGERVGDRTLAGQATPAAQRPRGGPARRPGVAPPVGAARAAGACPRCACAHARVPAWARGGLAALAASRHHQMVAVWIVRPLVKAPPPRTVPQLSQQRVHMLRRQPLRQRHAPARRAAARGAAGTVLRLCVAAVGSLRCAAAQAGPDGRQAWVEARDGDRRVGAQGAGCNCMERPGRFSVWYGV